jgi:hypothetical protein
MVRLTDDDKRAIAILTVALEEQRRFHSELTANFDIQKSRIVYYIGATLATLTFLYSGALDSTKSMRQKLFIPEELYGILFYFFGIGCVIYALFVLARGMRQDGRWEVFTEATERKVIGDVSSSLTEREYLQEMVNGYEEYIGKNLKFHETKVRSTKSAFFPMLMGAIILIVLRLFQ